MVCGTREEETQGGILNIGDNFTGNPVSDLYEPKGKPIRELLNLMQFDAMTIGNHDFDHGQQVTKLFIKEANFPSYAPISKYPKTLLSLNRNLLKY